MGRLDYLKRGKLGKVDFLLTALENYYCARTEKPRLKKSFCRIERGFHSIRWINENEVEAFPARSLAYIISVVGYKVFAFIGKLQAVGNLNTEMLEILLKSVGIGLLSEIAVLVCCDMGNASMGKTLQILSMAVILWLSLPLFSSLLDLIGKILGEV